MAKSMTGYGRAEEVLHERSLAVEIKSVNSRYFEYNMRLPRNMGFLEDPVKKLVSSRTSRGRVEVGLNVQSLAGGNTQVTANIPVATEYYEAVSEIAAALMIENDTTASTIARFSDVFTVTRCEEDEEELTADVLKVAGEALNRYEQMRALEGEKLVADIRERLKAIEEMLQKVEKDSAGRVQRYKDRLYEKLKEILEDKSIEEARILTEAALFADKTAVDEETVRLRSHLRQFAEILAKEGAVGRKLDFLTQELNREVNTIGSKCQEVEITRLVVDMKSEIEKIREQIQNME
ncbi:YicC family protein [Ruminococcaceae bacterium OttesenSCG-928-I18]|nr:YicC family protein [Ruminococcaceae bacterium OttesenSCG-928-I18]